MGSKVGEEAGRRSMTQFFSFEFHIIKGVVWHVCLPISAPLSPWVDKFHITIQLVISCRSMKNSVGLEIRGPYLVNSSTRRP